MTSLHLNSCRKKFSKGDIKVIFKSFLNHF
jgi:hypothetical protein